MRRTNLLMLGVIIASGFLTISCSEEQFDNPSTQPQQASAEDHGTWWIDEAQMDKSVYPGDNFYMYCIGTWWKNTPIPAESNFIYYFTNLKPTFQERVKSVVNADANYQKYLSHLKWNDDGSEAAIAGQQAYDDALAQSGLMEAATPEDVLRAFGKLATMGVTPPIIFYPFIMDGKVCLCARHCYAETMTGIIEEEKISPDDPAVQSHLVPLVGRGRTRGVPDNCMPLKYIIEGMGFNPNDIYLLDEHYKKKNALDENINSIVQYTIEYFDKYFNLSLPIDQLKKNALEYYKVDYPFISQTTRDAFNAEMAKKYGEESSDDDKASLGVLNKSLYECYSYYLRAKIVAEQMVPQNVKDDYKKYCEELRAVFAQRIRDNAWLSETSKRNALEKLNAMIFNVGYPDTWIAEGLPDFTNSKSLVEDIYILRKAHINLLKAVAGKSREEVAFTVVLMDLTNPIETENSFYHPYMNMFTIFPYYILPPFYDPAQSLAINYAYMSTIGHEMTHGFDSNGYVYDKNGDYIEGGIWGSPTDMAEFKLRTEQLVKWIESLYLLPDEMPGVHAEGKKTVAENIADLGGAEIAYQAFLNRLAADGYTGDNLKQMKERFFIAYTEQFRAKYNSDFINFAVYGKENPYGPDPHCMSKERVNGILPHMDGWYDAFNITHGTLYRSPEDRIRIW